MTKELLQLVDMSSLDRLNGVLSQYLVFRYSRGCLPRGATKRVDRTDG